MVQTRRAGDGDSLWDDVIALKRDRILQEAATLFFERGYHQTSVDAIAERLGATKPFVYYHFKSKIDLLVEICERGTRDALAATELTTGKAGTPRERFEQFVRAFTQTVLKNQQYVAIYFREQINLPAQSADLIIEMRKTIDRKLRGLLDEGLKSGDFDIDDPRISALVIAGMSSYAFAWYRKGGSLDQDLITEQIVLMALKLVSKPAA